MLTTNIVQKATIFLIYILVARYLGAHRFGQLALATALLFSWHKLALLGLKTFVTRESIAEPGVVGVVSSSRECHRFFCIALSATLCSCCS